MEELTVYNSQGKKVDKYSLDKDIFDGKVNQTLIKQAVCVFLANQRQGLASAKSRGQVRGGGKKPWRQKGTGRARVGSIRSPLWVGGGVVFGPKPRDYSKKLNSRMKNLALKSALNQKLKENNIILIDQISLKDYKTKNIALLLKNLGIENTSLRIIVDKVEENVKLASRNINKCELEKADNLTAYTALANKKLLITVQAFKILEERLKKWVKKASTQF